MGLTRRAPAAGRHVAPSTADALAAQRSGVALVAAGLFVCVASVVVSGKLVQAVALGLLIAGVTMTVRAQARVTAADRAAAAEAVVVAAAPLPDPACPPLTRQTVVAAVAAQSLTRPSPMSALRAAGTEAAPMPAWPRRPTT